MRILITGGSGFIGSALIRHLAASTNHSVFNIDSLTYAHNSSLDLLPSTFYYQLLQGDICDAQALSQAFSLFHPDAVMHLAAETHVDRSILSPAKFVQTNILGTSLLLDSALMYWQNLSFEEKLKFRFHYISTDEVFGHLGKYNEPFTELSPYAPRNPYAASKAAADHLVRSYFHTYSFPIIITNTCNNYGPWQFPDKLIPKIILSAISLRPILIYGSGLNIRDWIYVEDHAKALTTVIERGIPGKTYCIGARSPLTNIELAYKICYILDYIRPNILSYSNRIELSADRPGHDFRYEINPSYIESALDWHPQYKLEDALPITINWYLNNLDWALPLYLNQPARV